MNAPTDKATRRRRKAPQRVVSTHHSEPDRHPFIFGWGADLDKHQRESLKERIALFAGIAIAVVVIGLLGWGLLYDNVIQPANQRAADNRPIAIIGNYTIRTGLFTNFEKLQYTSVSNQLAQYQTELTQLNAQGATKNAATISQVQQQISQLQGAQTSIAQDTLNAMVNDQIAIQRGYVLGVKPTVAAQQAALTQAEHAAGGPKHFQANYAGTGISPDQLDMLLLGDYLQAKLQAKIAAQTPHTQLEVRASHILIPATELSLAKKLYREVKNGAPIGPLAKKYSTDKGSATHGGDLGYFPKGQMVKPFDQAAFSMKVGEVRLVKSTFGWHIIKVTGRGQQPVTGTAYQQQQASNYQSWLDRQKTALHYQEIVSPASLPAVATGTPASVLPPQPVVTAPVPATTAAPLPRATTSTVKVGPTGKTHTTKP